MSLCREYEDYDLEVIQGVDLSMILPVIPLSLDLSTKVYLVLSGLGSQCETRPQETTINDGDIYKYHERQLLPENIFGELLTDLTEQRHICMSGLQNT